MTEFDHGPPAAIARHFAEVPDPPVKADFWFDWGPIFYRGRLDGSARVLCIASDPGPTERIAGRSLVGNAGQRVQGLLAKLGLTHSYLCLNAWAYALHPGSAASAEKKRMEEESPLKDKEQLQWRNGLYDKATGPKLEAVIAFGGMAKAAVSLWPGSSAAKVFEIPHPSDHSEKDLLDRWRAALPKLREAIAPDSDGDNTGANYGAKFSEADYAPIPRRDLPFGAPAFLGDDSWVRAKPGSGMNSVERPPGDDHTLLWIAPESE
jgi:hypothetical protein